MFYYLVRRGTYARLVCNWYQNIFHAIAVLIVFHAANEKTEENKIKTRQQIKIGKSKRCCHCQSTWLIIALLLHRCSPLSLRCRSVVAPLSHRYCTDIVSLSLRRCHSVFALLSHRYRTAITPLSLRCFHSCCRYAVALLSLRCCTVVEPISLRHRENINNSILNCCCSTVAPLSLLLSIGRFTRLSPQEA